MRKVFVSLFLLALSWSGQAWGRPATIFDYSAQLKLQESQTQSLRNLLQDLRQENERLQAALIQEERKFRQLVAQQAELGTIRKSLDSIRDLRVSLRMLDLQTQRKLENVLSAEQLGQWRAIQAQIQAQKKP
ncbi:MAG: hypothetical protein U0931_30285 [Vulcanimicrobiota bacterium]